MSDAAVHQPSPAKRGRGRGRGGTARGGASARARGKPSVGRRGRAKVYDNSRAQAAHERQRDLKNAYATLAAAMKPALEELADRNLDRLRSDFNAHKEVDQYHEIISFLDQRFKERVADLNNARDLSINTTTHELMAKNDYVQKGYQNIIADKVDDFYDTLLRRAELLLQLSNNGEPLNKLDDSYNYKSITTEEAAQQGIYRKIHKGIEVPYPQLHPELAREANKPNDPRTPSKRKAAYLSEDQPTPKRPASALTSTAIPRHIGGLLSAVAPDEPASQPASPSPEPEDEDEPSAADEPVPARRGRKPRAQLEASPGANPDETPEVDEDEQVPLIPNGASDPDEFGVRLITKRARINDAPNNRIMIPPLFEYEDHEIGFRDSTNDKTRGATKAKRKKFLDKPNSNAMLFDRTVGGYDATSYVDGELDKEALEKHKLHPKFGIFLHSSVNEEEPPRPYESGWKPTVFVTETGKIQHTSRSIPAAKASEDQRRMDLMALLNQHLADEGIDLADLEDEEYQRLVKERDERRLEQKRQEVAAQDKHDQHLFGMNIDILLDAADQADRKQAQEAQNPQPSQSVSPTVSRPSTRSLKYDAVRDVFGGSDLPPTVPNVAPIDNSGASNLLMLADMALSQAEEVAAPDPASGPTSAPFPSNSHQLTIQMPEPVRPKQLRSPSDLEQHGSLVKFTSANPFVPEPLAPQLPHFVSRDPAYAPQPPPSYQERKVYDSPLAHPDNFAYRETGVPYEQVPTQQMQPPKPHAFMGQPNSQPPKGAQEYAYAGPETPYEASQVRRPSQISQDDQYAPARPNTEDVAISDSQTLLDPQLFEDGQRPAPSQLQAPQLEQTQQLQPVQSGGVLQQPQNSFFQTALNSPGTAGSQEQPHQPDYPEPPQAQQQSGSQVAATQRPAPVNESSPGRTPFSHPNGSDQQPLPVLRPLHRGSGPLVAPTAQAPAPRHIMMTPSDPADDYHPSPSAQYYDQGYHANGYAPDQPIMSTEQGPRPAGYVAQPMLQNSQQPPPYPSQYPPPGHSGSQPPPQYELQMVQSPPPFGNGPGGSPSPSRRSGSFSSSSRNNKAQYREIKPAPRMAEVYDANGSELRTLLYNPAEGIRDYQATAPPPSHGPTQIRGWTHTTGSRKSRGKSSSDSQIDPLLGQAERK
ncbi:hypothetical protein N0V93_004803 [Gnomoniopsis smithogilvyi]|uniref:Uncharacterized protein n=1 Tax=Gnomoniopsis smithogilvyi TaxID=1191159 RepID=A0A9W8YT92_9PEZI|nr:hypothetical protein N0V93_004803 [Gnomoniopsis smithogilvyi]